MVSSRFEFQRGSGKALAEIAHKSSRGISNAGDNILGLKFEVTRYFDLDDKKSLVSVTNCYCDAEIAGVLFSRIDCPLFFDLSSELPEFQIKIPTFKINQVENSRNLGDLQIILHLTVLFTLHESNFFMSGKQYRNEVILSASIPKSQWIEEILPAWNYTLGKEVYLELRNLDKIKQVQDQLSKCRTYFIEGKYEEVLMNGYKLLEALPIYLGYNDVKDMFNKLNEFKPDYIKKKYDSLNEVYRGIKSITHLSRHSQISNAELVVDHIKRSDSKFFLHSLELLIDYVLEDF